MEINNLQLDFSLEVHYESFIPYESNKNMQNISELNRKSTEQRIRKYFLKIILVVYSQKKESISTLITLCLQLMISEDLLILWRIKRMKTP